jgi:hypothetical protein
MDDQGVEAIIRAALDAELQNQAWTMRDKEGHVTLVDGDVDTGYLAQAVVEALAARVEG